MGSLHRNSCFPGLLASPMVINRDLCVHRRMGGDADSDPHGHPALETGPSAGRGSEKGQARWYHSYCRDP